MSSPNRQKEKLGQCKYCVELSNADLQQVLVQNVWPTKGLLKIADTA